MKDVKNKQIQMPCFLKIKKGESSLHCLRQYGLVRCFLYTTDRKGWDMQSNGEEMYFIGGIQKWVPSKHFNVVTDFCPN